MFGVVFDGHVGFATGSEGGFEVGVTTGVCELEFGSFVGAE